MSDSKKVEFLTAKFTELSEFPDHIKSYETLHEYSIKCNEEFWEKVAKSRLEWFKIFDKVKNDSKFSQLENFDIKWFINGKLNASGIFTYKYAYSFKYNNCKQRC